MIQVSVDEAHAFDMLSILHVKNLNSTVDRAKLVEPLIDKLWEEICDQIGDHLAEKIFASDEYNNLYLANEEIFKMLDYVKQTDVPASVVDELNYYRFKVKKELQDKFFDYTLEEKKFGYDESLGS